MVGVRTNDALGIRFSMGSSTPHAPMDARLPLMRSVAVLRTTHKLLAHQPPFELLAPSLSSGSELTREQCYFTNPFMFFCRVLHRIVKERKAKSERRNGRQAWVSSDPARRNPLRVTCHTACQPTAYLLLLLHPYSNTGQGVCQVFLYVIPSEIWGYLEWLQGCSRGVVDNPEWDLGVFGGVVGAFGAEIT